MWEKKYIHGSEEERTNVSAEKDENKAFQWHPPNVPRHTKEGQRPRDEEQQ